MGIEVEIVIMCIIMGRFRNGTAYGMDSLAMLKTVTGPSMETALT